MILAIDSGNTSTVFGCVEKGCVIGQALRIATEPNATEFEYAAKINQIFSLYSIDPSSFEGAVISCVVPPLITVLARAVQMLIGREPLVVGAGVKTGLHIAINDPGTVAADLVTTAVAAKALYPLPCVIIDMGTATTLTVVDEKGRYIGGAILPGVGLSLNALSSGTALLPHVEIRPPKNVIAANTVDSMKAGIVYGTAGAIDGLLDRFSAELGTPPASIVATGGMSPLICPYCHHALTQDPNLAMKGLEIIWNKNN